MALFTRQIDDAPDVTDVVARVHTAVRSLSDSLVVADVATPLGTLRIANARSLSPRRVRLDFAPQASINAALSTPSSYAFVPISSGAVPIVAQSVRLPPGQTFPSFVEIDVNEMTDGAIYTVAIVGALVGKNGDPPAFNPTPFAGMGDNPDLFLVLAVDKNTVQVQFTEPMLDNAAIRNLNNYSFDGGLSILSIEAVEGSRVTLATSDQAPGALYNLTVRGILAARITDSVQVTDVSSDPGAFPPGLMTENGSPMTENGAFMTEV